MNGLKRRFPSRSEVFSVYSVIVVAVYTWAIIVFLYDLPSWVLTTSVWDIAGYLSYGLLFAFLESIILFAVILGMSLVFPASWLRNDLVVNGSVLAVLLYGWTSVFQTMFNALVQEPASLVWMFLLFAFVSTLFFVFVFHSVSLLRKAVERLSSSAGIFVVLYGFVTAIGIAIVLIRNLA